MFKDPLKLLIWAYLFLLIFEGALRKWILPGLSTPLLFARDPLVLLIYILAFPRTIKSFTNGYVLAITSISALSLLMTMVFGHGNLVVGVYGFRVMVLHFPLVFVMGSVLNKNDVVMMGRLILLISAPMTLLLIAQYSSPQSSTVNRLPGGTIGMGLTGALGKFRPPGTFSFITGVVQFYSLAGAFAVSSLIERKYFPMIITLGIAGCIVVAVPISISRTLFLNMVLIGGATVYAITKTKSSTKILTRLVILGLIGFVIAMQFSVFEDAQETFSARWEMSTDKKGGVEEAIFGRFFGLLYYPLKNLWNVPLFGQGLGIGTIVGAKLTTGNMTFLAGEGEWGRNIAEMGSILGLAAIIFRTVFTVKLGMICHKKLNSLNLLPWLLYVSTFLLILNGQWGQSTTLGFTVYGSGLCLGALKVPKKNTLQKKAQVSKKMVKPLPPKPSPPNSKKNRPLPPLK